MFSKVPSLAFVSITLELLLSVILGIHPLLIVLFGLIELTPVLAKLSLESNNVLPGPQQVFRALHLVS